MISSRTGARLRKRCATAEARRTLLLLPQVWQGWGAVKVDPAANGWRFASRPPTGPPSIVMAGIVATGSVVLGFGSCLGGTDCCLYLPPVGLGRLVRSRSFVLTERVPTVRPLLTTRPDSRLLLPPPRRGGILLLARRACLGIRMHSAFLRISDREAPSQASSAGLISLCAVVLGYRLNPFRLVTRQLPGRP